MLKHSIAVPALLTGVFTSVASPLCADLETQPSFVPISDMTIATGVPKLMASDDRFDLILAWGGKQIKDDGAPVYNQSLYDPISRTLCQWQMATDIERKEVRLTQSRCAQDSMLPVTWLEDSVKSVDMGLILNGGIMVPLLKTAPREDATIRESMMMADADNITYIYVRDWTLDKVCTSLYYGFNEPGAKVDSIPFGCVNVAGDAKQHLEQYMGITRADYDPKANGVMAPALR